MPFNPEEKKSLSIIASLYLIRMLGLFMVLPVLSLYGTELRGSTPFLIGLALGIYGLTQALLQIPFGWASDKVGRKKVLIVGFCLFVLGSLLCALADNICLLIIGRALQGAGAISAVLLALLADQSQRGQQDGLYGHYRHFHRCLFWSVCCRCPCHCRLLSADSPPSLI